MFLADVVGTVVSPVQHPVLESRRLLLLRVLDPRGRPTSTTRIGIDVARAGPGDRVLVVDEGNAGRQLLDAPQAPVKTVVVGVVDFVELDGELVFDHRTRPPLEEHPRP
ncbi:MAG: EutN/CcmL family microcompartment protein [Planctomycetota bacterium]